MAGGAEEFKFTGWRYYFNSYTQKGRLNFVLCTYGACILAFLYKKTKGKKTPAIEGPK